MPKSRIGTGLPDLPSGLPDKDFSLVSPLYRAITSLVRQISTAIGAEEYTQADLSRMNSTQLLSIGARGSQLIVTAAEPLALGKAVNLIDVSGVLTARLADASDLTKQAHGFVATPQGIATGTKGIIIFMSGFVPGISGTVVGTTYWLSTNGNVQASKPTGSGIHKQVVGIGLGDAGLMAAIQPQEH